MLMEIAIGLQMRPKSADDLLAAPSSSTSARSKSARATHALLSARIQARKATALQAVPRIGTASLEAARDALSVAMPVVRVHMARLRNWQKPR